MEDRVAETMVTRMVMRPSTLLLAGTALVVSVLVAPSAHAASTVQEEIEVPGTLEWQRGQRPGDPGDCSSLGFVQWKDVPGTVSARVYYTFNGQERSQAGTPPFDDAITWVATYNVLPGYHWINISKSWRNGPGVATCEEEQRRQQAIVTTPVRVVLTVEKDKTACVKAQEARKKAQGTVNRLKRRVQAASGNRKATLRVKLNGAKRKLAKAKATQSRRC